jgi:translation initiation factor 2 beta subunit (eIF-2beta)/eIF-5
MDSSKMLNIPSTIKDPNYRYKMPKIIATTQGSGGNIKTKLDNIKEVSHSLTVPADYPLKFIGKELGSQTEIKNDIHLINGSHSADKLQALLDKFIEKYVLCPKCKLPEIRIFVKKEKTDIRCKCRACGTISKLDDKHKFSNHIKNFPPKYDEEPEKTPIVDEKGASKTQSTQAAKTQIDKETSLKIRQSAQKIGKLFDNTIDDVIPQIEGIIKENNFEMLVKYFVLINGIFDKNIYSQLKSRLPIIKNFLDKEEEGANNEAAFHIVCALADLCCNRFKELGKYVSSILYYFYEADILTEDFWIKFAIKSTLNYNSPFFTREIELKFFENAREFSDWLEFAPYEDEVDKVYKGFNQREHEKSKEKEKEKVLEEIDIDNI